MLWRNIYIPECQISIMGAPEALQFLDVLYKHRLLSRRTVAQYVVDTLLAGKESREGTPGYAVFEESVYGEIFDEMLGNRMQAGDDPNEEAVSNEAYFYLRKIIETSVDGMHRLSTLDPPYNGFSREAYNEVRDLLGSTGRRYLGIKAYRDRISMGKNMVHAIIIEDGEDGPDNQSIQVTGPEATLQDMKQMEDDMKRAADEMKWEPDEPWMEPFPTGIARGGEGNPRDYGSYRREHALV